MSPRWVGCFAGTCDIVTRLAMRRSVEHVDAPLGPAPDLRQSHVETGPRARGQVGVAVAGDHRQPDPGARRVAVTSLEVILT